MLPTMMASADGLHVALHSHVLSHVMQLQAGIWTVTAGEQVMHSYLAAESKHAVVESHSNKAGFECKQARGVVPERQDPAACVVVVVDGCHRVQFRLAVKLPHFDCVVTRKGDHTV